MNNALLPAFQRLIEKAADVEGIDQEVLGRVLGHLSADLSARLAIVQRKIEGAAVILERAIDTLKAQQGMNSVGPCRGGQDCGG
ncbi:flagellar motor switch protein FliG [Rhizobium azooxidifex]|uniref:Flagellar motor switch protein FliG n=1 Tax=Mycoplana azooxidifex TaxID=1636188 RepID=A0A7W6D8T2_9HYPH|nr:flagellar motor switch protein FliG [Mycoplana azooxidifex]